MDKAELQKLAGIVTEAKEEKKAKGSTCPFCGTHVEHGKLVEHIKSHHGDLIEYYNEHKEDKKDEEKKED